MSLDVVLKRLLVCELAHRPHRPHSSSASGLTAGAAGFFRRHTNPAPVSIAKNEKECWPSHCQGGEIPRMASPEAIKPRVREIAMLMNRTFFLACATVVTLGIAAASSAPAYARPCSKADSDRERTACYVRSAIYRAEAAASEALAKSKRSRDGSTAARLRRHLAPTAENPADIKTGASAGTACLTKQYLETGAVLFKDTCTKEWAMNSTTFAGRAPGSGECLTKDSLDNGAVMFRDTCTNEWAMNTSQQPRTMR
jgi:hypothetical protein